MNGPSQPRLLRSRLVRLVELTLLGAFLGYAFSPWPDAESRWQQERLPTVILIYTIIGASLGLAIECAIRVRESGNRFSLGGLLMATTLFAVVLGVIVWGMQGL